MRTRRGLLGVLAGTVLSACAGVPDPDADRGGGVSRTLPDPAWVILLDRHQDEYPRHWAFVFAADSLEACRNETSYAESDLNLAPRSQYSGEEIEAKSLSDVRQGRTRAGRIVRLERADG